MSESDRNNHFLSGGAQYASNRPGYPPALAKFLASRCSNTEHALDVGCGSGQLAVSLAEHFDQVSATDPSIAQLKSAREHPLVTYRAEPAEQISYPDASVDLIGAAQAAHWFDLELFYDQVRRVARPEALLALVSYGVPEMSGVVGERFNRLYWQDIHSFWPEGRHHVEGGYRTLSFPFDEQVTPQLWITREWSRDQVIGYVSTWSASKRARAAGESAIISNFARDLSALWQEQGAMLAVRWPIAIRLGRVHTSHSIRAIDRTTV